MEQLIKRETVLVGKGIMMVPVFLWPLIELAKLLVKVLSGLVEALILGSCLDRELLARQL